MCLSKKIETHTPPLIFYSFLSHIIWLNTDIIIKIKADIDEVKKNLNRMEAEFKDARKNIGGNVGKISDKINGL